MKKIFYIIVVNKAILKEMKLNFIPSKVIAGTGIRHYKTAAALHLEINAYSDICGSSITLNGKQQVERLSEKIKIDNKKFIFSDPFCFLQKLEDKTALITDKFFLYNLGYHEVKEGQVVEVQYDYDSFYIPLNYIDFKLLYDSYGTKNN